MSRKRLLKLTWVDDTGTVYHTADLSPRAARDLILRDGDSWPRLYIDHRQLPFSCLTWEEVRRARRAPVVKLQGDKLGHEIIIDAV